MKFQNMAVRRVLVFIIGVFVLLPSGLFAGGALQIDKAFIGAADNWTDITAFLRDRLQGDVLSVTISQPFTDIGGDPAPGKGKHLIIDYHMNSQARRLWLQEDFPVAFEIKLPSPKAEAPGANPQVTALMENISATSLRKNEARQESESTTGSVTAGTNPGSQDFIEVARVVTKLLRSGDAPAFAKAMAPSVEDWNNWLATNRPANEGDPLPASFRKSLEDHRQKLEASAKRVLAVIANVKVDFSRAQFVVTPKAYASIGGVHYSIQAEKQFLPFTEKLEMVLAVSFAAATSQPARGGGDYKLVLHDLVRFPTGWRCDGLQWMAFPPDVANAKIQRELVIAARASSYQGLTETDDPALTGMGESLIRFIQTRDLKRFKDETLPSSEADSEEQGEVVKSARHVLEQLDQFGIDFAGSTVQVKKVILKSLFPRSGVGEVEGVEGNQLTVRFTVQSSQKSRTGASLSGDYVLGASEVVRKDNHWRLTGKLQWAEFPNEVLDKKATAELTLENYVAEHGTLPPGSAAPDIEFVRLDNQQRMSLPELRGKVVVLDFWSVSCGPCQEGLQKMQQYNAQNPAWKGKVELVPINIDNSLSSAREHMARRGWTNTVNVWAGPGAWESTPAKAFRVTALPVCYIIGTNGVIVDADYTFSMDIPAIVNGLLK